MTGFLDSMLGRFPSAVTERPFTRPGGADPRGATHRLIRPLNESIRRGLRDSLKKRR